MDNKATDEARKAFERRLLYSMELAIVARAESEGLLPSMWEAEKLRMKIRENYYRETGHRL